jgi:hypothetical protein
VLFFAMSSTEKVSVPRCDGGHVERWMKARFSLRKILVDCCLFLTPFFLFDCPCFFGGDDFRDVMGGKERAT